MRGLSQVFRYVRFFLQADTKEMRNQAALSARDWCIQRNRPWTDSYRAEYDRFVSSYITNYCHTTAMSKLKGQQS